MIHVQRNASQQIIAIQRHEPGEVGMQDADWQECDADDPEVQAFALTIVNPANSAEKQLKPLLETDLALARVLEDLIDLLVDRSMIRFTDFPPAAQAKLMERHNARHALRELHLLSEETQINDETL